MTAQNQQLDLFASAADDAERPDGRLRIATWNVNGIRARETQVAEWIAEDRPDVVCLQELKASPAQIPAALCGLAGYECYWHGEGGYSGVALLVRRAAFAEAPSFAHPSFDFENRIVVATMGPLSVASIYVPNGGKDFEAKVRFLQALDGWVAERRAEGRSLVLCGDLNVARADIDVHPKERKPNKAVIGQLPEERDMLEHLLSHGMVDLARHLAPDDDTIFTWWAPWRSLRQRNIGWRIDYVLGSEDMADKVTSCVVRREIGTSDHAPVLALFDPVERPAS